MTDEHPSISLMRMLERDAAMIKALEYWRETLIENERLKAGLKMLAKAEYDAGYTPEGFAEAILSGDEPRAEP